MNPKDTYWDIDTEKATQLLNSHYKIKGKLYPLPGEIDQNFKVIAEKGNKYVFKITPENIELDFLDFQKKLLLHLNGQKAPKEICDKKGNSIVLIQHKSGKKKYLRLLTWTSGRLWSHVNPHSEQLLLSLGKSCGNVTKTLQTFNHAYAIRKFDWDLSQSLWVEKHFELFNLDQRNLIVGFTNAFKKKHKAYNSLRKSIVHNDANNNNIIVSDNILNPEVISLIDYGDAIHTQIINDLAITCAYAIMEVPDPLEASLAVVSGYHHSFPLNENELEFLYNLIAIRLIVSVTKSAINKIENPLNEYLWISEQPAWELLQKWVKVNEEFAHYRFREVCGFEPHPNYSEFIKWTKTKKINFSSLFPTLKKEKIYFLDLSVSSNWLGTKEEYNDLDYFQYKIKALQKENLDKLIAGGYLESRVFYSSKTYDNEGTQGLEKRCLHLGVDFWIPAGTPINAIFKGKVVMITNDKGEKTFGGLIVLEHKINHLTFYTLYGHLSKKTLSKTQIGDKINKGDFIGWIGDCNENGNWAPHLHFQVLLSLLDYKNDFPGVGYQKELATWKSLCPNPNLFFKSSYLNLSKKKDSKLIIKDRKHNLGRGMKLQYKQPIQIVRGEGIFLVDQDGRHYMDMVNNVAHVGHEHPKVVKVGQMQMAQLNTNSRYLHKSITQLAKRLISTLPPSLSVVHFVNSGSEANELALRMIKTFTGSNQILACEYGYHGNTNGCVDVSSYKFDGKGGNGRPENTHIFPIPDSFRGKYRGNDTTSSYVGEVIKLIEKLQKQKKHLGGIIIEPIISCGGQIELPKRFLAKVFKEVRKSGGLCVVDEVQTGCGRMGSHFWGFQLHNVIPDIVTIGKPLGNGHPVAAVVCTPEIADTFNNGMEFFNTFGGNPVSCVIADKVLQIVLEENLQENAFKVGGYLKKALKQLAKSYSFIGSVRGQGLFLGVEFVDRQNNPMREKAEYFINRMKFFGILLSTDGPCKNVIKIKPPIIFSYKNAQDFLKYFSMVIEEDFMKL